MQNDLTDTDTICFVSNQHHDFPIQGAAKNHQHVVEKATIFHKVTNMAYMNAHSHKSYGKPVHSVDSSQTLARFHCQNF